MAGGPGGNLLNTLDIAISCGVTPRKVAGTKGGEYASACPVCGGRDRFRIWPERGRDGTWFCRGCDKRGDAIALLEHAKGLTFKEACDHLGRTPQARRRARSPMAPADRACSKDLGTNAAFSPSELWQKKAAAFISASSSALMNNAGQLSWLAERGITRETAARFRLGWNPSEFWRERSAWGVADEGKRLWFPAGLVIPCFAGGGEVHRLRIRRPDPDVEPRYVRVSSGEGSGSASMSIPSSGPGGIEAWVVVESELDAILIAQDAGDLVGVAALGSVSVRPDTALSARLAAAALILVSLDADEAGARAWPRWQARYPQADRWPVPHGKDPGDYRKAGGDIRAWILAGLPPGLRPAPTAQNLTKEAAPDGSLDTTRPPPCDPVPGPQETATKADVYPAAPEPDDPFAHLIRRAQITCPRCKTVYDVRYARGHIPLTGPCARCILDKKKGVS